MRSATPGNAWSRRTGSSASRRASGSPLNGTGRSPARAAAIETVVRELLQMVVIDLAADENAQEIFETLNARGAQLTAADLIKNFIFQRLLESGTDVEAAYREQLEGVRDWFLGDRDQRRPASIPSIVDLPQSLVDCTDRRRGRGSGGVRSIQDVCRHDAGAADDRAARAGSRAPRASTASSSLPPRRYTGAIDRLGLFGYRTGVLESEVIKPLVLCLLDPEEPADSRRPVCQGAGRRRELDGPTNARPRDDEELQPSSRGARRASCASQTGRRPAT